ncbi:MAG TPA: CorA family divalent cation transporter [Gemmatimonadales bacterium]|nr:CorA family divalent cation transporter [Gemmatimonadales bacterium]
MRHDVMQTAQCRWIDVVGPTPQELHDLAVEFDLPPSAVEDSLDPEHLPKLERFSETTFLIMRARDRNAPEDAGTPQELTRKVAIFYREGLLVTVHRAELEEISTLRQRFGAPDASEPTTVAVLAAVILAILDSYDFPLGSNEAALDAFEENIFDDDLPAPTLRDMHNLKRRIGLTRRLLWQMSNVLAKLVPPAERAEPVYQDMRESAEAYLFWVEQIYDEVNQLLQLHLAMASNRTNDVMRVLTVFSAFFLPLTFVVGVYGMNFANMPELHARAGYFIVLGVMALMSIGIWAWFRRRGWL